MARGVVGKGSAICHTGTVIEPGDDPRWYEDAIIYEVHVRAFGDSNGDGIGDLPGLTQRLDHLQSLGVTAVWLLPFYPSPLRDDGYDIADYGGINPAYGTLRDFKAFLKEAHARDLRVITELVLNHTSDQHPWFQKSRRAAPGSKWRDFYVWSDTPDRYKGVRIIFEDYETSNWSWDPVAGAYYFHRFFSHQPDLNYDNPEVRATMLRVVDQWMDLGVDGVRVDAVPYLFEREGTSCENLPETHEFLRDLRAHVDEKYEGRMLLAEANQWPEDAVAYFGEGDEFHMAFHFPVMPRLYMSLRMEDRHPVIDILQQTPDIPEGCQWATFLRNHDELTLEMVTDEERDYMYRAYAADPQARVNLGIRRRLAPLLQNDRRKIELMNALLFSLPGTPVIYYGDEMGMGDNVYLGDRDAVRTPMQWSPDRNAGFSSANPQQLYLPVIIDSEYHFETVNVEAQQANPSSLLHWMRRIISVRQRHPVFGRGELDFLYPENAKVLAFVRHDEHEQILVVANLSRFAQSVHLDLHEHRGAVPVELFGGTEFPQVGEGPYHLTLSAYGFFWFRLDTHHQEALAHAGDGPGLPELRTARDWRDLVTGRQRHALAQALPQFLERNRWYAGRTKGLRTVEITDVVPMGARRDRPTAFLTLVHVDYAHGESETYVVPLTVVAERAEQFLVDEPDSAIAWVTVKGHAPMLLVDAMAVPDYVHLLLDTLERRRSFPGAGTGAGELRVWASPQFRRIVAEADDLTPSRIVGEQSNSSVVFDSRLVMKVFRRAQEGVNPDLEIGRYLTETADFHHTAPTVGAIEYQVGRKEPRTLAVVNGYVANEGDAWKYTLDALSLYYESVLTALPDEALVEPVWDDLLAGNEAEPPPPVADAIGPYLDSALQLGRRTAELHSALSQGIGEDFEPEPFTGLAQRSLFQGVRGQVRPTMSLIRRTLGQLAPDDAAMAEQVLAAEADIVERYAALRGPTVDATRIRIHGDLHLGQVLHAGRDWVIIDFEGEPSRSPTERRIKKSALVDVAGMVRSFQYAAEGGLRAHIDRGLASPEEEDLLAVRGRIWQLWVTTRYLAGYLAEADGDGYVPSDEADLAMLLRVLLLDKALYEVRYDLAHRPHWAGIPLAGVLQLLEA